MVYLILNDMKLKFCCLNFEETYYADNSSSPNIRIIKFVSPLMIARYGLSFWEHNGEIPPEFRARAYAKRSDLSYYLTLGYDVFSFDSTFFVNMNYCPFCGTNLFKFYNKDKYVNEVEGETFIL